MMGPVLLCLDGRACTCSAHMLLCLGCALKSMRGVRGALSTNVAGSGGGSGGGVLV